MKRIGGKHFISGAIILAAASFIAMPAHGGGSTARERVAPAGPAVNLEGIREQGFQLEKSFGRLPLYFIPNQGQVDPRASFYAKTRSYTLWFGAGGLVFERIRAAAAEGEKPVPPGSQRPEPSSHFRRDVSRLEFLGANRNPQISGEREQPCRVNYFIGNDSSKWKTAIATFAEVRYRSLYNSIDLRVYGVESRIEYDWEVLPGGDPRAIRFRYAGVQQTTITSTGDLLVETASGKLTHKRPVAYQEIEGRRVAVTAEFKKLGKHEFGFAVGGYDKGRTLTIDPLVYATFLGGSNEITSEYIYSVALDGGGNAYVTGHTTASDFPVTAGSYDGGAGGSYDVFVTKINATGTAIVYSTFLGGTNYEYGVSLALTSGNMVYIAGLTCSSNFPTTAGAYDTTYNDGADAFVAKLSADGSVLAYSTFLGGVDRDEANAIAYNGTNLFVAGATYSSNFPTTAAAYDTSFNGGEQDIFVTKFNTGESALVYSTYIGGSSNWDWANAVAVDGTGNAYVVGGTWSNDYPVTAGAFDATRNNSDGVVTKINAAGSALVWSTFLGGSGFGDAEGIKVDASNCATVCGFDDSSDFPVTAGAFDVSHNGGSDAYVCKFNAAGTALLYSTYLGGSGEEIVFRGFALGTDGSAYVAGSTASADFPVTSSAHDASYNGNQDAFVARLAADGSSLAYSTFLGGALAKEKGRAVAVSGDDFCLVGETTEAADFPATPAAFDTAYNGLGETFVAKFSSRAVTVVYPNGGESFNAGTDHDIRWSANSSIAAVSIFISTDNGASWHLVEANIANDGSQYWIAPAVASAACRIKVCDAANPAVSDVSDGAFAIASPSGETISPPTVPSGAGAGSFGASYSFTTGGAVSSLGHNLRYMFDWGDGSTSSWLAVGTTTASHSWAAAGTYHVRALARCSSHVMLFSLWSEPHAVAISDGTVTEYYNSPAQQLILPEVNWALASTGGTWVSEVHIIDVTGGSTVQAYYNSGTTRRGPFTLWTNAGGSGSSTSFSNVLETLSGLDAGFTYYGTSGALELVTQDGSHKLQASSRTYNGNYSRTFPALVDTDTNSAASGRTLIISNISYNGSYRPSVVLYNPSASSVTAGVTVLGADGSTVVTTSRTLAGHEMSVVTSELRVGSYSNATVKVEVTAGSGRVLASGQTANNTTSDPAAHLAVQSGSGYANSAAAQVILPEVNWALASTGGTWISEVQLVDITGGSTVRAYYNSGTTRRGPFTLWTNAGGAGSSTSFSNILETLSGLDAGFTYYGTSGALELVTQDGSHKLQASSRTYNGNYSRTFPALVDTEAATAASGRSLVISNISYNGSYRPSVVLYNPSADSVTVAVTVLGGDGSTTLTTSRTLAGHEMSVITSELRVGSYSNATVLVEVTAGSGRVLASGQTANNTTSDPAAHLAVQGQ